MPPRTLEVGEVGAMTEGPTCEGFLVLGRGYRLGAGVSGDGFRAVK